MVLIEYYEKIKNFKIDNKNQPLILVKKQGQNKEIRHLFFLPNLCHFTGLDDKVINDQAFMKKLSFYTKLNPNDRIQKTNEFLNLLKDNNRKEPNILSPKEKSELYGLEILPARDNFRAYQMNETILMGGNNKRLSSRDKKCPLLKKVNMKKWLCFYITNNYNEADYLYKTLFNASKAYEINISEPEWVEMNNYDKVEEWKKQADYYLAKGNYQFIVFLLNAKNDGMYPKLKKHSLCTNGYVSQVIKTNSFNKNAMSVCSKILLQINAKLRGANYKVVMDKSIKDRRLMVIGVDSSHIKGKRTCVAMIATIDNNLQIFII